MIAKAGKVQGSDSYHVFMWQGKPILEATWKVETQFDSTLYSFGLKSIYEKRHFLDLYNGVDVIINLLLVLIV